MRLRLRGGFVEELLVVVEYRSRNYSTATSMDNMTVMNFSLQDIDPRLKRGMGKRDSAFNESNCDMCIYFYDRNTLSQGSDSL